MGITIFLLLALVFLFATAGSAATLKLVHNSGVDLLKIGQLGEHQIYKQLQHSEIRNYTEHN